MGLKWVGLKWVGLNEARRDHCMWNVLRAMSPGGFSSCMCTHMVQVRVMPPHTVNCR